EPPQPAFPLLLPAAHSRKEPPGEADCHTTAIIPRLPFHQPVQNQRQLAQHPLHPRRVAHGYLRRSTPCGTRWIIEDLRARLATVEGKPLFQKGEPVTIIQGPFKDLDAVFCKADGEERAIVLLNLLHRQQEL